MFLCWCFVLALVQLASARVRIPTTAGPISPCPDSTWLAQTSGSSCIKAFSSPKVSWSDARSECRKLGADLVQIRDAETNELVRSLLTKGHRYWTGVSDSNEDGTFEYLNGRSLAASFQPWAIGEPNNKGGSERCVEIIGKGRGSWNDKRCSKKRAFVCEVSAPQIPTTPRPSNTTPRVRLTTARSLPVFSTTSETTDPAFSILSTSFEQDDLPSHYNDLNNRWSRFSDPWAHSGQYVLKMNHDPHTAGEGRLISLPVNISETGCMSFYYKVLSSNVNVYAYGTGELYGHTVSHDEIRTWNRAFFDMTPEPSPVQLTLWVGSEDQPGTAFLDDLHHYKGSCYENGLLEP